MTSLSSKIIERIKQEKMTPKPRWHFMLIKGSLAAAFIISIILGSLGVAIVIRHFALTDWEMAHQFSGSHIRSFFLILPYLWLIIIGLIILLAELVLKHTKTGYRVSSWKFVTLSIALSIFFGGACYFMEIDEPIELGLRSNFGPYAQVREWENEIFVSPERGVLAGRILAIKSNNAWQVVDLRNEEWLVDISEAVMKGKFPVQVGLPVGLIGRMTSLNHFKADRVGPWKMVILTPPPPPTRILIIPKN